jgi:betaine-aldehyde dehydrogenase
LTTNTVVMGDNMEETTNMGPTMMHPHQPSKHYDQVMGFIERAKSDEKLALIHGGNGYFRNGAYFVEPTIFLGQSDDPELVQHEVFGPVMVVLPFDSEDEAVQRANNTAFGLAAGAMTSNIQRAHRLVKTLQAGNVWINQWNITPVELPFGPIKMSGYGRELGLEAMDAYSQVKTVYMEMEPVHESATFVEKNKR